MGFGGSPIEGSPALWDPPNGGFHERILVYIVGVPFFWGFVEKIAAIYSYVQLFARNRRKAINLQHVKSPSSRVPKTNLKHSERSTALVTQDAGLPRHNVQAMLSSDNHKCHV